MAKSAPKKSASISAPATPAARPAPSAAPAEQATGSRSQAPGPEKLYTADEMRELERKNIIAALERTNWKVAGDGGAAALLGVKPSTLTYQIRSFGIERES